MIATTDSVAGEGYSPNVGQKVFSEVHMQERYQIGAQKLSLQSTASTMLRPSHNTLEACVKSSSLDASLRAQKETWHSF
jgi:hypothetical protein